MMGVGVTGSALWSNRATSLGLSLGQDLLVEVSTFSRVGQGVLGSAELGQVEGGDLLGLLDLLLVALDLALQLVDEGLHALVVLAVLITLEGELLDLALALPQVLLGVSQTSVLGVQLGLKLPDASLHLAHGLLASLQRVLLGVVQATLHLLGLGLQQLLVVLQSLGQLLLCTQLIGQAGGVDHRLLGLLLGETGLADHLVEISTKGLHFLVKLPLGALDGLVSAGLVTQSLVGIAELLLN